MWFLWQPIHSKDLSALLITRSLEGAQLQRYHALRLQIIQGENRQLDGPIDSNKSYENDDDSTRLSGEHD